MSAHLVWIDVAQARRPLLRDPAEELAEKEFRVGRAHRLKESAAPRRQPLDQAPAVGEQKITPGKAPAKRLGVRVADAPPHGAPNMEQKERRLEVLPRPHDFAPNAPGRRRRLL